MRKIHHEKVYEKTLTRRTFLRERMLKYNIYVQETICGGF